MIHTTPFRSFLLIALIFCGGCKKGKPSAEDVRAAEEQKEIDWYKSGTVRLAKTSDPVDGSIECRDPDGKLRMAGTFVDGKEDGPWVFYDSQGIKMADLAMKRGSLSGSCTFYYSSLAPAGAAGKIQVEFLFDETGRTGYYSAFYPTGKKMIMAELQGRQVKTAHSWDELGKVDNPATTAAITVKAIASDDQLLADLGREEQMFMTQSRRESISAQQ